MQKWALHKVFCLKSQRCVQKNFGCESGVDAVTALPAAIVHRTKKQNSDGEVSILMIGEWEGVFMLCDYTALTSDVEECLIYTYCCFNVKKIWFE